MDFFLFCKHSHVGVCCVSCSPTLFNIDSTYLKIFSLYSLTWSNRGQPIKIISYASLVPMCWGLSFLNQQAMVTHEKYEPTPLLWYINCRALWGLGHLWSSQTSVHLGSEGSLADHTFHVSGPFGLPILRETCQVYCMADETMSLHSFGQLGSPG